MSALLQRHLHVCSLAAVTETVRETNARALVSVLHPTLIPETPLTITPDNHIKLAIDDIEAPQTGLHHADRTEVEDLCNFAETWQRDEAKSGAMVIHCFAGISRSTAVAFVILCCLNPKTSEQTIADHLRAQSPTASPNRLIVALGDEILNRQGRMSKAIRTMRPPATTEAVLPFSIATKFESSQKRRLFGPKAA